MGFDEDKIKKVWNKGKRIRSRDPKKYRKDKCDAIMYFSSYGKTSKMGWEIDHIIPNKVDKLRNLQPLQWNNNRAKGYGKLKCNKPRKTIKKKG